MYTVCWIDENNKDRWERCESRSDVIALLMREHLQNDEDVLIFSPEAEDSTVTCEDLFLMLGIESAL